jgi:hypothetical protein
MAANAVIGWRNRFDAGFLAPSSESAGPAANLKHPDINLRWRTNPALGAAHLIVTFDAPETIGAVAAINVGNFAPGDPFRVRYNSTDPTGFTGDLWDTGAATVAPFNPLFPKLVQVIPGADVPGVRVVRVDLPAGVTVGRFFMGPLFRPRYGLAAGFDPSAVDTSVRTQTRAATWIVDEQPTFRAFSLPWQVITIPEYRTEVAPMMMTVGNHTDVLICLDPESDDPGLDTIWGLLGGQDGRSPPVRVPGRPDAPLYHSMILEPVERV